MGVFQHSRFGVFHSRAIIPHHIILAAKTGVVKNNEKANTSLFIFLFYRTKVIYSKIIVTNHTKFFLPNWIILSIINILIEAITLVFCN